MSNQESHKGHCTDNVRNQINENAITDGEVSSDMVLIDTDTVWGCNVGELVALYLSDGTASCTC